MWATNFIEWFNKWTVIRQGTVTNTTACDFVVVWLFPIYESPERWRQQVRAGNSQSQMRSALSQIRLVDLTMTLAKDYYCACLAVSWCKLKWRPVFLWSIHFLFLQFQCTYGNAANWADGLPGCQKDVSYFSKLYIVVIACFLYVFLLRSAIAEFRPQLCRPELLYHLTLFERRLRIPAFEHKGDIAQQ